MADSTGLFRPALVIRREGFHLTWTMTHQAVLTAGCRMGDGRDRSSFDWMAVEADLLGLKRVIPGEGFYLAGSVASQAFFPAMYGMQDNRYPRGVPNGMAGGAGFVGLTLVFLGKIFRCAVATQAVQATWYRVWYGWSFVVQAWESIGRSSDEQQHHERNTS